MMKQNIITGIVIIALVAAFALVQKITEKKPIEYFEVKGYVSRENTFIQDYQSMKKFLKEINIQNEMTSSKTFEKFNISEYFNEEYFVDKKVAVVILYEDDSKGYIHSIDDVVYDKNKTNATVNYTYKSDRYVGQLKQTWRTYMFVEVDGTVENVSFIRVKNNIEE